MPRPRPITPTKRMRAKAFDVLERIIADPAADPLDVVEAATAILDAEQREMAEARMRAVEAALARLLDLAEDQAARTEAIDSQEREAQWLVMEAAPRQAAETKAAAAALEARREVALVEALERAAARRVYRLPERTK